MADKTFPGETIKQIRAQDMREFIIRCSDGKDPDGPAEGEPILVGIRFNIRGGNGEFKRKTSVSKDVAGLSAAKKAILTGLLTDGRTYAQKKLDDATKPEEV